MYSVAHMGHVLKTRVSKSRNVLYPSFSSHTLLLQELANSPGFAKVTETIEKLETKWKDPEHIIRRTRMALEAVSTKECP